MNRFTTVFLIYAFSFFLCHSSFGQVRTVHPKKDDIIEVRTSLAFATIIQFPDAKTLQFPIIGDQSAFRIESIENGITKGLSVKPLRSGARTNLYLFTDKERLNFRLITEREPKADYIVYIKNSEASDTLRWQKVDKSFSSKSLKISLLRFAITESQMLLLDLRLFSLKDEFPVVAENFWVYQDKTSKVISSLFLSNTQVSLKKPLQVGIALSIADLKKTSDLEIIYKSKSAPVQVKISKDVLWK